MKVGLGLLLLGLVGVALACWFWASPAERRVVPVAAAPRPARTPVTAERTLDTPDPPVESAPEEETAEEDGPPGDPETGRPGSERERAAPVVDLGPHLRRLQDIPHAVKGLVVGADGVPTLAKVHLIGAEGGSSSHDTGRAEGGDRGLFSFTEEQVLPGPFHLKATTLDGRVALVSDLTSDDGRLDALVLELRPGASLEFELVGEIDHLRCAVFQGGVRHVDFTLRRGNLAQDVVPAGTHLLELYEDSDGGRTVHLQRSISVAAGARERLRLEPGS